MEKISKRTTTLLVILVCVTSVYATKTLIQQFRKGGSTATNARMKGKKDAPIKIVEFIDFQCPACAFGAAYLKEMFEKYPEAIRVEVKHYPLKMHRHGLLSSRYAECAARQGKFWPFQDMLLARRSNWQRLADADPVFAQIADDSGLDEQKLKACLKDPTIDEAIKKDKEEGGALGVKSTPTYFVNEKMVVGKKSLDAAIMRLLEKNGY
ncbi:MAG: thioredoxin domain-containing protein [Candidatus Omnitrophica bacterium]|nr:thioredoxin domain-containing protein [Candidatus Omnitrophota bacterium]